MEPCNSSVYLRVMSLTNQIKALRAKIPVPITEAKQLLQEMNGDVQRAFQFIRTKQLKSLSVKTGYPVQEIGGVFSYFKHDYGLTLSHFKRLRDYVDYDPEKVKNINPEIFKFLDEFEQLEGTENIAAALHHSQFGQINTFIKEKLEMPELAGVFEQAISTGKYTEAQTAWNTSNIVYEESKERIWNDYQRSQRLVDLGPNEMLKIENPKVEVYSKLWLISLAVEEKYKGQIPACYWEPINETITNEIIIFYRVWLWLCYIDWEDLVPSIEECYHIFDPEKLLEFDKYLAGQRGDTDLEQYFSTDHDAGTLLLDWAKRNLL